MNKDTGMNFDLNPTSALWQCFGSVQMFFLQMLLIKRVDFLLFVDIAFDKKLEMDPPPAYPHVPSAPPAPGAFYEPAPPPSAPPPSYAQVSNTQCTFVDFVPECLEGKGLFSSTPLYESFE